MKPDPKVGTIVPKPGPKAGTRGHLAVADSSRTTPIVQLIEHSVLATCRTSRCASSSPSTRAPRCLVMCAGRSRSIWPYLLGAPGLKLRHVGTHGGDVELGPELAEHRQPVLAQHFYRSVDTESGSDGKAVVAAIDQPPPPIRHVCQRLAATPTSPPPAPTVFRAGAVSFKPCSRQTRCSRTYRGRLRMNA